MIEKREKRERGGGSLFFFYPLVFTPLGAKKKGRGERKKGSTAGGAADRPSFAI